AAPGAERSTAEIRRPLAARSGFLVSRLHRLDALVARRDGVSRCARSAARATHALAAADPPRDPVAARARASAFLAAATERGERLGRHHAEIGLRAVHQRAVVPGETALRP